MTPYRFLALIFCLIIATFAKYAVGSGQIIEYIGITSLVGGGFCMLTNGDGVLVTFETDNSAVHAICGALVYAFFACLILGIYLMVKYLFS